MVSRWGLNPLFNDLMSLCMYCSHRPAKSKHLPRKMIMIDMPHNSYEPYSRYLHQYLSLPYSASLSPQQEAYAFRVLGILPPVLFGLFSPFTICAALTLSQSRAQISSSSSPSSGSGITSPPASRRMDTSDAGRTK